MFLPANDRKIIFLLFIIFGSFFVSPTLYVTLSYLLGGILLGSLVKGRRVFLVISLAFSGVILFMNDQMVFAFNLFYPYVFAGVVWLIYRYLENVNKGDIFMLSTIIVSIFFVFFMAFLEKKTGLISNTIAEAFSEVDNISGNILKGVMDEKAVKEYQEFSKSLIKKYYPFLALLQFIIFGFVNLYIVTKLFPDIPPRLAEPFSNINISFFGVWLVNLGILLFIIFGEKGLGLIGINLALYFLAFYFFQGIATTNLFFARFGIPLFVAFFFYFFFLANHIMWFLISFIGVLDVKFDIKKRLKEA
ncbi:MAG: YybS family protein [Proteobacteria bacterium]|nr:YybS family protein [Pseudomonadota bacterium]